jgi:signal transduction histidine kinase
LVAQAVLNLIENALRHAGEANKTISVEVDSYPDNYVTVSVSDRGQGIPDGMLTAAMERFVRIDASRSSMGTGLGLSLVKAIAEAHGGKLELSDNGPGLRATIFFAGPDNR